MLWPATDAVVTPYPPHHTLLSSSRCSPSPPHLLYINIPFPSCIHTKGELRYVASAFTSRARTCYAPGLITIDAGNAVGIMRLTSRRRWWWTALRCKRVKGVETTLTTAGDSTRPAGATRALPLLRFDARSCISGRWHLRAYTGVHSRGQDARVEYP